MLLAKIVGNAVATVKHPSMQGWRLLVVQAIKSNGQPDGDPYLAIDPIGAGSAQLVIISNDGRGTRQVVGNENSPIRWMVIGVCDD